MAVIGPHIVDVLGRPVETIPAGQGSARLTEIRATAAGTAAGHRRRPREAGRAASARSARSATTCSPTSCWPRWRRTVSRPAGLVRTPAAQTSATILPIRPNGERPALHVPGATRLLQLADLDLAALAELDALLLGGPDALTGLSGSDLAAVVTAARSGRRAGR